MVKKFEKLLVGGIWCIVTLAYYYEENQKESPFVFLELKPIQMPNMDLSGLFEGRRHFNKTADTNIPIYLERRVFTQIALEVCRLADDKNQVELIVKTRPSILDGKYKIPQNSCSELENF